VNFDLFFGVSMTKDSNIETRLVSLYVMCKTEGGRGMKGPSSP
jgi:hypothetical protein